MSYRYYERQIECSCNFGILNIANMLIHQKVTVYIQRILYSYWKMDTFKKFSDSSCAYTPISTVKMDIFTKHFYVFCMDSYV